MIITKKYAEIIENSLNVVDRLFEKLDPPRFRARSFFSIVLGAVLVIGIIIFGILFISSFYLIMCSEYFISRIIFKYGIKIDDISLDTKKWLEQESKNWIFMEYSIDESIWPLNGNDNEIRFLSKNDALKFKMVWG